MLPFLWLGKGGDTELLPGGDLDDLSLEFEEESLLLELYGRELLELLKDELEKGLLRLKYPEWTSEKKDPLAFDALELTLETGVEALDRDEIAPADDDEVAVLDVGVCP